MPGALAWLSWLGSLLASLRCDLAGPELCLDWFCFAQWLRSGLALRSSLFALRPLFRLCLGFAAICFAWSWLRFGMAWLGLGFVVAQCLRFAPVLTGSGAPVW